MTLEFWSRRNIKKASILLKIMKALLRSGKSEEKVKEMMLYFEETINDLYLKDDILNTIFTFAGSIDDNVGPALYDFPYEVRTTEHIDKFPIEGGSILSCVNYLKNDQVATPIKSFFQ